MSKYIIIEAYSPSIEEKVNEKIKEGYKPIGSLTITRKPNYPDCDVYVQAMIKDDETKS